MLIDDLASFIAASPSSFHAAAEVARRLEEAGFTRLDERDDWGGGSRGAGLTGVGVPSPGRYLVVRDGAVIAWVVPAGASGASGFRIVGSHTDSPALKLKPRPGTATHGWLQAGVEVYGGPLLNSWLDRDLELAGRLVTVDGAEHLVRTGPLLRIPQLAIHLDRAVNDEGLRLDRQRHLVPVIGAGAGPSAGAEAAGAEAAGVEMADGEAAPGATAGGGADLRPGSDPLLTRLAELAGVAVADIVGHDLVTCDTQAPAWLGLRGELFAAPRMDNLVSVHASVRALIAAGEGKGVGSATSEDADGAPGRIRVLAAFDHEEVGSASRSGAAGPFLADVLARISDGLGASASEARRALADSVCLSADAGHAVHPNYPERHDPMHRPVPGGGPLLKVNASQRYASDAPGAAVWARACAVAGVPFQTFVSNNAVPCGSTIGPITATRLGMRTVDVGVPLLSMHSARELVHVDDVAALAGALEAFLA